MLGQLGLEPGHRPAARSASFSSTPASGAASAMILRFAGAVCGERKRLGERGDGLVVWPCWACAFASATFRVRKFALFELKTDSRGLQRLRIVGERNSEAAQEDSINAENPLIELDRQSRCLAVANRFSQLEDRHMVFVEFWMDAPTGIAIFINGFPDVPTGLVEIRRRVPQDDRPDLVGVPCGGRQQPQFSERDVPVESPAWSAPGQAGIGQGFQTKTLNALPFRREHERVGVEPTRMVLVSEDRTILLQIQFSAGFGLHLDRCRNGPVAGLGRTAA